MTVDDPKQPFVDFSQLQSKLFEFTYRPKHRVQSDYVYAENLTDARKKCNDFCNRHGVTFVYVRPMLLNLNAGLRNPHTGEQMPGEIKGNPTVPEVKKDKVVEDGKV